MGAVHSANFALHPFLPPTAAESIRLHCRKQRNGKTQGTSTRSSQRQKASKAQPTPTSQLRPMPRCSSFDMGREYFSATTSIDPQYASWRSSFEELRLFSPRIERKMEARFHNMTEAISGQLTPKGFPAYSKAAGSKSLPTATKADSPIDAAAAKSTTKVRRRLSWRLPMLKSNKGSPPVDKSAPQEEAKPYQPQECQQPEPPVTEPINEEDKEKKTSNESTEEPEPRELLYEEMRDWQDYYGTRLEYYYL